MQLRYVILYVADVSATMDFYARAFGLEVRFLHDGGDYGEMATGETRLAFSSLALMQSLGKSVAMVALDQPSFELAFATEDVPAALDRALVAGATLVQAPTDMPWGQTISYVRAPEGTCIEICTPTD